MKTVEIGHLINGQQFKLKPNGRWYTVKEAAISCPMMIGGNTIYIISESQTILYAFYTNKKVYID